MPQTVYGSLAATNELINDACSNAEDIAVPEWWFSCAADAVANGDLDDAQYILGKIDDRVDDLNVLGPLRDARQLVVALQEDWSL